MKRLLSTTLFAAIMLSGLSALAVIDTDRLLSDDYLMNNGYSPETIRMMRLRQIDPYAPYQKEKFDKTPLGLMKKFVQYFDPASDNQNFGKSIIDPRTDFPSRMMNNY